MSFCVECGAQVRTIKGLCTDCFVKHRRLVTPPKSLDIVRCTSCSRLQVGKKWLVGDIETGIHLLLEKNVEVAKDVTFKTFTFDLRWEDANNVSVSARALLRVDDAELVDSFGTRVRVHGGTCPSCGRKSGFYYEAILQVRADDRRLTPREEVEVTTIINDFVSDAAEKGQAFISKVEPVRGGIDFYLSGHELGRNLAKEIRARYGGTIGVSPKLFGVKDGAEVYRTTHLVRLPRYKQGDVILIAGRPYEILRPGPHPRLRDLKTGAIASADKTKMEKAKIVPTERFAADVLAVTEKEIEYYDPTDATADVVSRPPGFKKTDKVDIVRTAEGSFISMLTDEEA